MPRKNTLRFAYIYLILHRRPEPRIRRLMQHYVNTEHSVTTKPNNT